MDATEPTSSPGHKHADRARPFLFLVLEGARPTAGGARLALAKVDAVVLGRGDERARTASGATVAWTIPDARMSTTHARVARIDGAFHVVDEGSTNGTLVNGDAIAAPAPLQDGDVITLGQSVFVYREITGDAASAGSTELRDTGPHGLGTLDAALAKRFERLSRVAAAPLSILFLGETGHREGGARARRARALEAPRAVRCRELRRDPVEPRREPPLRPRPRRVLGRDARRAGARAIWRTTARCSSTRSATCRRRRRRRSSACCKRARCSRSAARAPRSVDVRVLAATHKPLDALVERGEFRRDLYARLAGYVFQVAPLRERFVDPRPPRRVALRGRSASRPTSASTATPRARSSPTTGR